MQCKWKINALTIRLSNFSISLFRPYFSPSLLAAAALPAVPRAGVRKTALAQDSKSLCIWVCVCVVLKENTAVWLVKASSLITLARWKKVERQKEEFFIRTSSVTQGVTKGEIGCRRMCCKLFYLVQLFVSWLFFFSLLLVFWPKIQSFLVSSLPLLYECRFSSLHVSSPSGFSMPGHWHSQCRTSVFWHGFRRTPGFPTMPRTAVEGQPLPPRAWWECAQISSSCASRPGHTLATFDPLWSCTKQISFLIKPGWIFQKGF